MTIYQPPIRITDKDFERLTALTKQTPRELSSLLAEELGRAAVIPQKEIPKDVVTMNSTVRFVDLKTQEELEATLVYPNEADASKNRISILAPVGTALLGLRTGQKIHWPIPGGRSRHLLVSAVLVQPEAEGRWEL